MYNDGMLMFWCTGGPYLGFYRERGSTVRIVGYRTVTKTVQVWHDELVETKMPDTYQMVRIPEHYEMEAKEYFVPETKETRTRVVTEHYESKTVTEPAHWGTREYWLGPHIEIQYKEVPGHYEIKNIWVPEYYVTRYYWREAHPERGLEAAWIPYQHLIPAGYKDQRVWVETYQEPYEVEIPGCWQERRIWFPDVTRTYPVLIKEHEEEYSVPVPAHYEMREEKVYYPSTYVKVKVEGEIKMVRTTFYTWEDKEFQEPIFGYANLPYTENLELIEHHRGPVMVIAGEPEADTLKIRIVPTGDVYTTDAEFVGCAVKIGENEYVLPEKYWEQVE